MVNVGLVTDVVLPRPAARPLTNWVLPLPSSPLSASTDPAVSLSANSRPNFSVSAGLFEMNVTTGQFRISDCGLRNERADSGQREFREFSAPACLQPVAIAWRDGEEKFVIFAVGNGVVDLGAGIEGQTVDVDLESNLAGRRESGKISAKAVA